MVLHIVIYKPKPGTTNAEIETALAHVEELHRICTYMAFDIPYWDGEYTILSVPSLAKHSDEGSTGVTS